MSAERIAHGQVCYVQIPALDVGRSAAFYATAFGWTTGGASFEAPGMIGQFSDGLEPAVEGGILCWINVDVLPEALERVRAGGGEVLEDPHPDGPTRVLATVRDPAGNVVGVVEHLAPR